MVPILPKPLEDLLVGRRAEGRNGRGGSGGGISNGGGGSDVKNPKVGATGGGCVIPPGLTHDPTVCIIYGIKMTDSLGEIIMKKNNHKELKYFLYDRGILYSNPFNIIDWK